MEMVGGSQPYTPEEERRRQANPNEWNRAWAGNLTQTREQGQWVTRPDELVKKSVLRWDPIAEGLSPRTYMRFEQEGLGLRVSYERSPSSWEYYDCNYKAGRVASLVLAHWTCLDDECTWQPQRDHLHHCHYDLKTLRNEVATGKISLAAFRVLVEDCDMALRQGLEIAQLELQQIRERKAAVWAQLKSEKEDLDARCQALFQNNADAIAPLQSNVLFAKWNRSKIEAIEAGNLLIAEALVDERKALDGRMGAAKIRYGDENLLSQTIVQAEQQIADHARYLQLIEEQIRAKSSSERAPGVLPPAAREDKGKQDV